MDNLTLIYKIKKGQYLYCPLVLKKFINLLLSIPPLSYILYPITPLVLIANIPGANLGVVKIEESLGLLEIAKEYGIINLLYYSLIKTGFLPPIIFMGIGALTDFGPMLKNLRLVFFGAAAQFGIFTVLILANIFILVYPMMYW